MKEFSDTVFEAFHDFKPSSDILRKDYSIQILHMQRNSSGLARDLLSANIVVSLDIYCKCFHIQYIVRKVKIVNKSKCDEKQLVICTEWCSSFKRSIQGRPSGDFFNKKIVVIQDQL